MSTLKPLLDYTRRILGDDIADAVQRYMDVVSIFDWQVAQDEIDQLLRGFDHDSGDVCQLSEEVMYRMFNTCETIANAMGISFSDEAGLQIRCDLLRAASQIVDLDDPQLIIDTLNMDGENTEAMAQLLHQFAPHDADIIQDNLKTVDDSVLDKIREIVHSRVDKELQDANPINIQALSQQFNRIERVANGYALFAHQYLFSADTIGLPYRKYVDGYIQEFGANYDLDAIDPRIVALDSLALACISAEGQKDIYGCANLIASAVIPKLETITRVQEMLSQITTEMTNE